MHQTQEWGPYSNRNFNTTYLAHVSFCALKTETEAACLEDAEKRPSPGASSLAVKLKEKLLQGAGVGKRGISRAGPSEITLHGKVVSGLEFEYTGPQGEQEGIIGFKCFDETRPGTDYKYAFYARARRPGNGKEDGSKWECKVLVERRFLPDQVKSGRLKIKGKGEDQMSDHDKENLKERLDRIERFDKPNLVRW